MLSGIGEDRHLTGGKDFKLPRYTVKPLEEGDEYDIQCSAEELQLYLKKHKITSINNKLSIILDQKPVEVGIDPYNKLIDTNSDDNRKKVESL